jgi:hypothetical protein
VRIAINQPYLFPYRGYFDLIASVDRFVVHDNVQYIKKGWINRNNFPNLFTFRLKKHSNFDSINQCYFKDIEADKARFLRTTKLKAEKYLDLLTQEDDISTNITKTLKAICKDLGIKTEFFIASNIVHGKSWHGVLDIVKALNGDTYVNLPGGRALYNQEMFGDIKLEFVETKIGPSILCEI